MACYFPPDLGGARSSPGPATGCTWTASSVSAQIARQAAHAEAEAPTLLRLVQWLLEQELDHTVAQSELAMLTTNLASTYEELALLYRISGSMKVNQRRRSSSPASVASCWR